MFMTQLESAVAGIIIREMTIVAEKERMDVDVLRSLVTEGKVVIPCNTNKIECTSCRNFLCSLG